MADLNDLIKAGPMSDRDRVRRLQRAIRIATNLLTADAESDDDLPVCRDEALKELETASKEVAWSEPLPDHLVDKIS